MKIDTAKKAADLLNRLEDVERLKREAYAAGITDTGNEAIKDLYKIASVALDKLEQITKSQISELS